LRLALGEGGLENFAVDRHTGVLRIDTRAFGLAPRNKETSTGLGHGRSPSPPPVFYVVKEDICARRRDSPRSHVLSDAMGVVSKFM